MSARKLNENVSIPADAELTPDFPRTDGEEKRWPTNTKRIVTNGEVNYYRPCTLEDPVSIRWRIIVGARVAEQLNLPAGRTYVLKDWPAGYHMFDHNKGKQSNPRHDAYLIGSSACAKFRSANEFVPHALWLFSDPTLNTANCGCKYCTKQPQKIISSNLGLSMHGLGKSASPSPSLARKTRGVRDKRKGEPRAAIKKYAAIRRAPKPHTAKRVDAPTHPINSDKENDLSQLLTHGTVTPPRLVRKGELVWCQVSHPISVPHSEESIKFWPCIVVRVDLKVNITSHPIDQPLAIPRLSPDNGITFPDHFELPPGGKVPIYTPWTVQQYYQYGLKVLATPFHYDAIDSQIIPYLAYTPADGILDSVRTTLQEVMKDTSEEDIKIQLDQTYDFDPMSLQGDEDIRFKQSVTPFSLALEIGSSLARYWTPTDEFECHLTLPAIQNPQIPIVPPPVDGSQSLHTIISSASASNAKQNVSSTHEGFTGSPSLTQEDFTYRASHLLGQKPETFSQPHMISQLRYQGLWWGAERIWTDELVRLKTARVQFFPNGGQNVYPPSGPSASTLQYNTDGQPMDNPNLFGAGQRSLFMRVDGIFIVDSQGPDGKPVKETRVSGMLYELADLDWEDPFAPPPPPPPPPESGSKKGKKRATDGPSTTVPNDASSKSNKSRDPWRPPHFALPRAPHGYRFRPILHPGHEVVVSVSLIAGRYYPHLYAHPLLHSVVARALHVAAEDSIDLTRPLWAMEGLVPGVYQSMDPIYWKGNRDIMLAESDKTSRLAFKDMWLRTKNGSEEDGDGEDVSGLFAPDVGESISMVA
ncbi:Cryptic loci regulator 2 [Abortiporus biennis]